MAGSHRGLAPFDSGPLKSQPGRIHILLFSIPSPPLSLFPSYTPYWFNPSVYHGDRSI